MERAENCKEGKGFAPYIDFRLYNAAKVAYDMACNAVKRKYAGGSYYELKKALNRVKFTPPSVAEGGTVYYLVGYIAPYGGQPQKEQIALIYCVFLQNEPKIFFVRPVGGGRCKEEDIQCPAECGKVYSVVDFGLPPYRRGPALKRILGV